MGQKIDIKDIVREFFERDIGLNTNRWITGELLPYERKKVC